MQSVMNDVLDLCNIGIMDWEDK